MLLTPDRYAESTTEELLTEASLGRIGVDHAWVKAINARGMLVTGRQEVRRGRQYDEYPQAWWCQPPTVNVQRAHPDRQSAAHAELVD